ncbi:hypothetical protein [Metamycoplasma hyosynoviae]|uniref:hypothetical protein n=1 Tax=Metamycoplasma hyosynoviae TaxID=29559 RepID=UPI002358B168|nr:hypothetical protein [Metamycoplasma hyosynoviae]MDC8915993.1 hypothetical protein [Metamycoplasma hyosynoviae]MDC8917148.1 hypothetical protein [Metamycoplasma hyosynoviae]MDC8920182.1 hypothetical protein [Metamycoplasma hyosynoviae]MDC8962844.1 hypothetical protein [Metamycoplasma hyosynoviae]MDC8963399.1 hypothetical protein [Metamycoplasma hyosynoviae]
MKEQEQKNLNTQEPLQQNQGKVKTQNPKNKVIVWSAAGAAAAALSSVVSITTVFSNQRKVSFLDKVLQSIKIDVKDKDGKTKDDIKTITDFVSSGLNTKLYELIVETEEDQVNKQPLDKDKPYTTFRTKFAIRNKFTKAQSNYRAFEFRNIKPPKEKVELNKLGQISEKEEDRFNDKVQITFDFNFNRGKFLASEIAKKENGKFKYFNIFPRQDSEDPLQYEVVNIDVTTNDDEAEAVISYQLKVKSVDDEKFISDKLEIKFNDFAIPSTKLTDYLKGLNVNYKNVGSTYIQDANKEGIIEGTTINSNYEFEFETFEKLEDKIKTKLKIVDKNTKESSKAIEFEIAGFFDYKKAVENAANSITFDYTDKESTFASSLKKTNLTNTLLSQANSNNLEVVYVGDELIQEDEADSTKRTNAIVSFKIKDKKTQFESEQKTYKITNFKHYAIQSELDAYLNQTNVIAVDGVESKEATQVTQLSHLKQTIDANFEIDPGSVEISHPADLVSIKVSFRIKDKTGRSDIFSSQHQKEITGFKMPQELIESLAQKVKFDVANKQNRMAYEFWDNFSEIQTQNLDERCEIEGTPTVKQTNSNELTVTYKIKNKNDHSVISSTCTKVINNFKTVNDNEQNFTYDVIERNGNKVAVLTGRVKQVFKIPAKIGCYKVVKINTLYSNENFGKNYFVDIEEGIEEIEKLIINTYDDKYSQVLGIRLPKTIKKINTLIEGEASDLYYLEMYDNVQEITNLFSSYCNYYGKDEVYKAKKHYSTHTKYNLGVENFISLFPTEGDYNELLNVKGSFKIKLNESNGQKTINLRVNGDKFYLESSDQKTLYKFYDNKETSVEYIDDIAYTKLIKNAFTGNKIKKFVFKSNTINHFDHYMFDFTNYGLEELDLTNIKDYNFNFEEIAGLNYIKKLQLPDFPNDTDANVFDKTFRNWNAVEEVKLPKNVKKITKKIINFVKVTKINLDELTKLEQIGGDDVNQAQEVFNDLKIDTVDLSNSQLRKLSRKAFWWPDFNKIILPSTLSHVGPFVIFGEEKNKNYKYIYSNNPDEMKLAELTFTKKITIQIKGKTEKPTTWSEYWAGQFWTTQQPNGTTNSTGLEIKWNS